MPNTIWVFIFIPAVERNKIIAVHDAPPDRYQIENAVISTAHWISIETITVAKKNSKG
jgi:hypothetical protein